MMFHNKNRNNWNDFKMHVKTISLYLSIHSMPIKRRTLLNVVINKVLSCI